jgi:TPR repeat protein
MDTKEDSKALQAAVIKYQQAEFAAARSALEKLAAKNSMKAGRYLALIDLEQAADRGDITSKIALGNLYETGIAADYNLTKARSLYLSALADDHQDMEGYMLAAGADLGLGRIDLLNSEIDAARRHFEKAVQGGKPALHQQANLYLQLISAKQGEK